MKENKAEQTTMNEAWDQMGKAMNQATEMYFKELGNYLETFGTFRREMMEQMLATSKQLSELGESQFAFLTNLQKNVPSFGVIPAWTAMMRSFSDMYKTSAHRAT